MTYLLAKHKMRGEFEADLMQSILRRSMLNSIGIAILIIGLGSAEFIYWRSLKSASDAGFEDSPYDSRVYQQDVERTIGVFGLIMDEFSRTMAKLGEPGPLAITIAAGSLLAAGGCFFVASRMPRE